MDIEALQLAHDRLTRWLKEHALDGTAGISRGEFAAPSGDGHSRATSTRPVTMMDNDKLIWNRAIEAASKHLETAPVFSVKDDSVLHVVSKISIISACKAAIEKLKR